MEPVEPTPVPPTQVTRPWRATVRTVFQAIIALAAAAPFLVASVGVSPTLPLVAGFLAVAALVTRVMALPQVESFLARFFPWLAADPSAER
jgi:hypothetical protein